MRCVALRSGLPTLRPAGACSATPARGRQAGNHPRRVALFTRGPFLHANEGEGLTRAADTAAIMRQRDRSAIPNGPGRARPDQTGPAGSAASAAPAETRPAAPSAIGRQGIGWDRRLCFPHPRGAGRDGAADHFRSRVWRASFWQRLYSEQRGIGSGRRPKRPKRPKPGQTARLPAAAHPVPLPCSENLGPSRGPGLRSRVPKIIL